MVMHVDPVRPSHGGCYRLGAQPAARQQRSPAQSQGTIEKAAAGNAAPRYARTG